MKISRRIIVLLASTSLLLGISAPHASAAKPAGKPGGNTSPSADLSITITDSPDPALVGGEVIYLMTVSNAGPSSASVWLNAAIQGDSVGTVGSSQGSCFPFIESQLGRPLTLEDEIHCNLGTLLSGQKATVNAVRRTLGHGTLAVSASLYSPLPDPNTSNNQETESTTVATRAPVPGVAKPANACGDLIERRATVYYIGGGVPDGPGGGSCEFTSTGMSLTVSGSHIRPHYELNNEIHVFIYGMGRVLATCRGLGSCAATSSETVPAGTRLTCAAWESGAYWMAHTGIPGAGTYSCTG